MYSVFHRISSSGKQQSESLAMWFWDDILCPGALLAIEQLLTLCNGSGLLFASREH